MKQNEIKIYKISPDLMVNGKVENKISENVNMSTVSLISICAPLFPILGQISTNDVKYVMKSWAKI